MFTLPPTLGHVPADFAVNVAATVFCLIVAALMRLFWRRASAAGAQPFFRWLTSNRRNYSILVVSIIAIAFLAIGFSFHNAMTSAGIVWLGFISLIAVSAHLLRELSAFWGIGFNYITSTVSRTTYRDTMDRTTTSFALIGTNAFSFCDLPEFAAMLKRVRESRGRVRLLLADPSSQALSEAAVTRNKPPHEYQDQARYALGRIRQLCESVGAQIEVRTYRAERMDELPIFRTMLVNDAEAVASVAVYGRGDGGQSLPQIFARKMTSPRESPRCMYSVLNRYFESFWDNSCFVSDDLMNACRAQVISGELRRDRLV